jgi:hypothetical protein
MQIASTNLGRLTAAHSTQRLRQVRPLVTLFFSRFEKSSDAKTQLCQDDFEIALSRCNAIDIFAMQQGREEFWQ